MSCTCKGEQSASGFSDEVLKHIYSSWESPDELSHVVAVEPGGTEHTDLISVPHTRHYRSQEKWDSNEPECKVQQPLPNL